MALMQETNYNALSWVQGELQTTLSNAATYLTRYTSQSDINSMSHCVTQLHQTVGILDMLHLSGASMLAREMQSLASSVYNKKCSDPKAAQERLMQSLILLPNYLKQLTKIREDHPLHIIDTINELRSLHDKPIIEPYSLFLPILSVPLPNYISPQSAIPASQRDLQQDNLHQTFQMLLLEWIRNGQSGNLIQLSQVIHRLRLHSLEEPCIRLWWAAEGVIESLLTNGLDSNNAVKLLLGELRQPLTMQVKKGELHLLNKFPDELLKKLLFLVAQSTSDAEHTQSLKDTFSLHFFNNEQRHQIYNLSADALEQARKTLYDELQQTKEFVGQLEQQTPHKTRDLERLSQQLSDMANTLHWLRESTGEGLLQTEANNIASAVQSKSDLNRYQLLSLANALLKAEAVVQPAIHSSTNNGDLSAEQELLQHDMLKECLIEMMGIKEILSALDNGAAQDPVSLVSTASSQISTIAGNLAIIGFTEPAKLFSATANKLTDNAGTLSQARIDLFAETLASGELFMEGILQHGQPLDLIIKQAQENLSNIDALSNINKHSALQPLLPTTKITSVSRYISQLGQESTASLSSVARYITQQDNSKPGTIAAIIPALTIPNDLAREAVVAPNSSLLKKSAGVDTDDEIASIFTEEASDISREFHNLIPTWREQQDLDALIAIRRYFHTLKGSGRMAKAETISELAWAVEDMLNRVLDGILPSSRDIENIIVDTHSLLPELIYRFDQRQLDTTPAVDTIYQRIIAAIEAGPNENLPIEDELRLIFNLEATQHIVSLQNEAEKVNGGLFTVQKGILRSAHSLKGCAAIANVTSIATLALKLEQTLRQIYEQQQPLDGKRTTLLQAILVDIKDIIDQVNDTDLDSDSLNTDFIEDKIARLLPADLRYIDTQSDDKKAFDPEILAVFLEESDEFLVEYIASATRWFNAPSDTHRDAVYHNLKELEGSANLAGISTMCDIYHQMADILIQSNTSSPMLHELLDEGHQQLHNQVDSLINNYPRPPIDVFNANVERFLTNANSSTVQATSPIEPAFDAISEPMGDELLSIASPSEVVEVNIAPVDTFASPPEIIPAVESSDSGEDELLLAFTEEAGELLDSCADAIKRWEANPFNQSAQTQLQRDLHTLKGGARMVDIPAVANLSHHIETLVLSGVEDNHAINASFFTLLHRSQDRLAEMQEQLVQRRPLNPATDLQTDIAIFVSPAPAEIIAPTEVEKVHNVISLPVIESSTEKTTNQELILDSDKPAEIVLPPQKIGTSPAATEQIRVRSDLLDNLSNFAGEVSISRDRASQQNMASQQQITEMEETVNRLQEQLRNLEIETEAQILFRYEDTASGIQSEFDPLELDRFSMIQQLSRSLTESVSDLNDIRHSMSVLSRETEDVLLQQSRVNTELQQGLMNTRLLPFSGLVVRLERIVRQTSTELNKPTKLTITGAEKELDRTVLNRILAPIEHLLRNAITHGIEPEIQRQKSGKPAIGHIQLSIEHDGPEVVLTLSDDGQGIDLEKVRQKALELDLINEEEILSDDELTQLILLSGLSTSGDVSQLSGRGVGMDVVNNEIHALKGRLAIHSTPGQGTTFSIHLPLRLSIIQALIVSAHMQQYAIPLSNIHTVVHPNKSQLKILSSSPDTTFEHADETYQFFDLKTLIKPAHATDKSDANPSLLLFRTRNLQFALLVDSVHGNREVVVKPLSTQLNRIPAINGATVLGNGQIIFILDLLALIEQTSGTTEYTTSAKDNALIDSPTNTPESISEAPTRNRIAMVVDDSITMRKATGNLLKRNGFTVITARDGLDAISLLHEQIPDIILLDIEMPRMDGYEFATHVRHDIQFKELPIIMITSRAGEKHRERAMEIGVDGYLGKPYQENELLEEIEKLIGDTDHD